MLILLSLLHLLVPLFLISGVHCFLGACSLNCATKHIVTLLILLQVFQIIHGEAYIGRSKVESAAATCRSYVLSFFIFLLFLFPFKSSQEYVFIHV